MTRTHHKKGGGNRSPGNVSSCFLFLFDRVVFRLVAHELWIYICMVVVIRCGAIEMSFSGAGFDVICGVCLNGRDDGRHRLVSCKTTSFFGCSALAPWEPCISDLAMGVRVQFILLSSGLYRFKPKTGSRIHVDVISIDHVKSSRLVARARAGCDMHNINRSSPSNPYITTHYISTGSSIE